MTEYDKGRIAAYKEMQAYAASMVQGSDTSAWVDMAFYAHASIEDITDPLDIPEDEDVQLMHGTVQQN